METISLSEFISDTLDDWIITSVRALDKPAVGLGSIDVRHSDCLLSLRKPAIINKGCYRNGIDSWLYCYFSRCITQLCRLMVCVCLCCTN